MASMKADKPQVTTPAVKVQQAKASAQPASPAAAAKKAVQKLQETKKKITGAAAAKPTTAPAK